MRSYYETVHVAGRRDQIDRFLSRDRQIRHEPGVADGVEAFKRDVDMLVRDRTIDQIALLLGQGDLVFIVARGTHQGKPCAYVDLYRVEARSWSSIGAFPSRPRRRRRARTGTRRYDEHARG